MDLSNYKEMLPFYHILSLYSVKFSISWLLFIGDSKLFGGHKFTIPFRGSTQYLSVCLFIYLFPLQKKTQSQSLANKVNKTFVELN